MPIAIIPDDSSIEDNTSFNYEVESAVMKQSRNFCLAEERDCHVALAKQVLSKRRTASMQISQESPSMLSLRHERDLEGRCPDCGAQTHEFHVDPLTHSTVKVPLNIQNEVHSGRCLLCNPIVQPSYFAHFRGHHSTGMTQRIFTSHLNSVNSPWQGIQTHPRCVVDQAGQRDCYVECSKEIHDALVMLRSPCVDTLDVLTAMKQLPYDFRVQELGCKRLWILTWEDDNAVAVGRIGGISVILDAMARFPMNAHLQHCGCESLQNLALNEYNCEVICESQGVYLIVQAMMRHSKVAEIQRCGATAIASLAAQKNYHSLIHHAGGVHAIVVAAQSFSNNMCVLRASMDALQSLGYETPGRLNSTEDDFYGDEDDASCVVMTDYVQEPTLVCASSSYQ